MNNETNNANCTYIGKAPNMSPMTITISEKPMGDSAEHVSAYPAATGKEIRTMMKTNGIRISDAARIFGITQKNVRNRRRDGTNEGLHTWEWMRWLPSRFRTLEKLKSSSNWLPFENRGEVKLFRIRHFRSTYTCMGIKLSPDDDDIDWKESYTRNRARIHTRSGEKAVIFFGQIDQLSKVRGEAPVLPVMSRDPLDHVRAYGSIDLMLAHMHVQEHWDTIESGSEIDGLWLSNAYAGPRPSKADILKSDISDTCRLTQ